MQLLVNIHAYRKGNRVEINVDDNKGKKLKKIFSNDIQIMEKSHKKEKVDET